MTVRSDGVCCNEQCCSFVSVGIFPEADKDPVIQIANMVKRQGDKESFLRNVFTLNTCAPIVGADVLSFKTEGEMLEVCGFKYLVVLNIVSL